MRNFRFFLLLSFAVSFLWLSSCSKKKDATGGGNATLILGTWYVVESYNLDNGDTTNLMQVPKSDNNKGTFGSNGVVTSSSAGNSLPQQEYYRVVGNILYFSDDPLPATLSTSLIDGNVIWAEYIFKLNSNTLIIQGVNDDGSLSDYFEVSIR